MKDQKKAEQKPMTVSGAQAQFLRHLQDHQSSEFKKRADLIREAARAVDVISWRFSEFKDFSQKDRMEMLEKEVRNFEKAAAFLDRVCIYLRK